MTSETSRTIRVMEDDNILLIWHSVSGLQLWLGAVVQSRKEKKRKEKKRKVEGQWTVMGSRVS